MPELLIVGSGIAALRAALELPEPSSVVMLTKAEQVESNTGYAQGGIAAAIGHDDSPARHAADTLAAGDGLCDEDAVRMLVEEGPRYVRELMDWGARFDRDQDGRLALAREGGHQVRRVLHARDATGREICRVLWERMTQRSAIVVMEHALATDLLMKAGRCVGVRVLDGRGAVHEMRAAATLLATGGAGQLYRDTTNPPVASGDGVAMAFRAGARVVDLEFVQFHPTVLDVPGQPRLLLTEALRGEGARLINCAGEPFMERAHPLGDLAPRDRVARAIVREMDRTAGPVFLSLDRLAADYVHRRFPFLSAMCRRAGLDLARDPIPVRPAAHYMMGGVETDLGGRTSVPGLFAAGEVACTRVHGANRLASNSLLEGLVFGARAGQAMLQWWAGGGTEWGPSDAATTPGVRTDSQLRRSSGPGAAAPVREDDVRELLWRRAGLFRDAAGLQDALSVLDAAWRWAEDAPAPGDADVARLMSLITVGRLVARAALRRQESRGAHCRTDFPSRNDIDWNRHVAETRHDELDRSRRDAHLR